MYYLKKKTLQRRTFLRGAGNTMMSLPILQIMLNDNGTALAQGGAINPKYMFTFAGTSIAHATLQESPDSPFVEYFTPTGLGQDFAVQPGMGSLEKYPGLKEYLTIVSNLNVPDNDNEVGLMGQAASGGYHGFSINPIISGIAGETTSQNNDYVFLGRSSDQILVDHLGLNTKIKSLNLNSQNKRYRDKGDLGRRDWISIGPDASGKLVRKDQSNLQLAFESVFSGFSTDGGAAGAEMEQAFLKNKQKELLVVDRVLQNQKKLMGILGAEDKQVLEAYFEKVFALENKIRQLEFGMSASENCVPPAGPEALPVSQYGGYANEHLRTKYITELISMALICDVTNIATFTTFSGQSFMSAEHYSSDPSNYYFKDRAWSASDKTTTDIHEMTHSQGNHRAHAMVLAWSVDQFFYVANELNKVKIGDKSLLDHSALVFNLESGVSNRPDPNNNLVQNPHSGENKVVIVAGKAGGINAGRHVDGARAHPAEVTLAAMQAVAPTATSLGNITNPFDLK